MGFPVEHEITSNKDMSRYHLEESFMQHPSIRHGQGCKRGVDAGEPMPRV